MGFIKYDSLFGTGCIIVVAVPISVVSAAGAIGYITLCGLPLIVVVVVVVGTGVASIHWLSR